MNGEPENSQGSETPEKEKRPPEQPSGETEWLRIMLEEIDRKQAELEDERIETQRREASGE